MNSSEKRHISQINCEVETERFENTGLFSKIFENAPLVMIVVDPDGKVEKINHATSEALGKQKADALGLLAGELFDCVNSLSGEGCGKNPDCKKCIVRNTIIRTFATSENVYKAEGKLRIKVGDQFSTRYLVLSTTFIEPSDHNVLLLTVDDVTSQKMVEKELRESKQMLEAAKNEAEFANRAKSDFLAKMSHELRTPLNSVIGFSDILLTENHGKLNEKQSVYVANISTSGKHLLGLINDILDLSKVEAGKMELNLSPVSVPFTVHEVLGIVSPQAAAKNIELKYDINHEIGLLDVDESKFKQILLNLLSNAIKFTPPDGLIELKGRTVHNMLSMSVIDSGIGISSDQQETIFDPFRQADSSLSCECKGTGLGLAIVKRFVEMHGGEVYVESDAGKGSTFTFTLPLSHPQDQ